MQNDIFREFVSLLTFALLSLNAASVSYCAKCHWWCFSLPFPVLFFISFGCHCFSFGCHFSDLLHFKCVCALVWYVFLFFCYRIRVQKKKTLSNSVWCDSHANGILSSLQVHHFLFVCIEKYEFHSFFPFCPGCQCIECNKNELLNVCLRKKKITKKRARNFFSTFWIQRFFSHFSIHRISNALYDSCARPNVHVH